MGDRQLPTLPRVAGGDRSSHTMALAPIPSVNSGATNTKGTGGTGLSATSELKEQQRQRDLNVDAWSRVCEGEAVDFHDEGLTYLLATHLHACPASRFERQLRSALQSTEHLGTPNAFRTTVCFDVLANVSGKFERFRKIMGAIRDEVDCAVYAPSGSAGAPPKLNSTRVGNPGRSLSTVADSFARKTYYAELSEVLTGKQSLERDLVHLDDTFAFMTKQLRTNEQVMDRLARRWARVVMKQTLVDWKKIIMRKKYTRVLLEKTSGRWSKQRLLWLFRRWAEFAGTEKVRKAQARLAHSHEMQLDSQELLTKLEQQIESAKQEARSNREHVDFARRQLLGLEDLLRQLELRVRQSNERKLQAIVNQWGRLCFALVDCELQHLQNMLDAVRPAQYVDATLLTLKGEELGELLALPSDVLVLRWINFQLSQCATFHYYSASNVSGGGVGGSSSSSSRAGVGAGTDNAAGTEAGFIQNFTTDMRGHYVLRHVLQRVLTMSAADPALRRQSTFVSRRDGGATPDPPFAARAPTPFPTRHELRAALSERLAPACPAFLSDQVLASEAVGDLTFCLFGFLVCEHPSLRTTAQPPPPSASWSRRTPAPPQAPSTLSHASRASVSRPPSQAASSCRGGDPLSPWHDAQLALDDARAVWESVREQWTELQMPFEIQETTKTTPDATNPPQLLLQATVALQNAVNVVQYACSKRSCVLKTWSCVHRKVQQDALRLLLRRGRKESPIVLMDRRAWREKCMLTTLHVSRLAAQFMAQDAGVSTGTTTGDSHSRHYEHKLPATRDLLEAELQEVESVLEEHYEALRRVYRFYASIEQSNGLKEAPVAPSAASASTALEADEERFFHKIAASMSLLEFHAFLKDCRVFGTTRAFPYAFIQSVFVQVNAQVAAASDAAVLAAPGQLSLARGTVDDAGGASDGAGGCERTRAPPGSVGGDSADEMTPAEFVEALLHVARSKYVCFKRSSGGSSGSQTATLTLAQRVRKCLEEVVLPRAMQEKERESMFRPQLLTAECREVFAKHHKRLVALYTRFAQSDSGASDQYAGGSEANGPSSSSSAVSGSKSYSSSSSKMLSVSGLVALCRHFELLREHFLTLDDVQHVLAEVLQLERESVSIQRSGGGSTSDATAGGKELATAVSSRPLPSSSAEPTTAGSDSPDSPDSRGGGGDGGGEDNDLSLTFAEYVEALAAFACYLRPDAFVPLATKIDDFCLRELPAF
ncbi:hypothetical protein PybrP1_011108 [[Pythium] brassicae (nom. inval.)]|nr:hypothetical protein PybrP1_011108 [[Pythium] brassicae (nom. inval.)]